MTLITTAGSCCRPSDIPAEHRTKKQFCFIVGIVPGPSEPPDVTPYFQKTFTSLKEYRPPGRDETGPVQKLPVTAYDDTAVDGTVRQSKIEVHLVLTSVMANTPARNKLGAWQTATARLGCPWCLLRSQPKDASNGACVLGYEIPVLCGYTRDVQQVEIACMEPPWKSAGLDPPQNNRHLVGAPEIRLSQKAQEERDEAVEGGLIASNYAGSLGVSMFIRGLPYTTWVTIADE